MIIQNNQKLEQLIFETSTSYCEEDFFVSEYNFYAYKLISSWPEIWGMKPYKNIVLLTGPKLSGKTYLSYIWQKKSNAIFINSPFVVNNDYEKNSNFILDDIDYKWKETELLHLFNWINECNKFALLTISSPIDLYSIPDLKSRLKSLVTVEIHLPNQKQIKDLLSNYFYKNNLIVETKIIDYLSYILPRDFSTIINIAKYINKISIQKKQKPTLPFVKKIFEIYYEQKNYDKI